MRRGLLFLLSCAVGDDGDVGVRLSVCVGRLSVSCPCILFNGCVFASMRVKSVVVLVVVPLAVCVCACFPVCILLSSVWTVSCRRVYPFRSPLTAPLEFSISSTRCPPLPGTPSDCSPWVSWHCCSVHPGLCDPHSCSHSCQLFGHATQLDRSPEYGRPSILCCHCFGMPTRWSISVQYASRGF